MTHRNNEEFNALLKYINEQLDKLPIPQNKKDKILINLLKLQKITLEAREPRIALVGRRGAGKSSLINALFGSEKQLVSSVKSGTGKGKWLWYPHESVKKIKLLDSRGLGESEKPTETFENESPLEEIKQAISEDQPDVFLFLIKAKETDARIGEDLQELKKLRAIVKEKYDYDVPVICIITQVDELDPPHYKQVPFDGNVKKANNIKEATILMMKRFEEAKIPLLNTIPTCSYIDFDTEGNIEYDMRWNIDLLANYLIDSLPDEAKLKAAKVMQIMSVKKKVALVIVGLISGIAGLLGTEPIPLADLPFLTALQSTMVIIVGVIAGRELTIKTATEFIGALGVNIGLAFAIREGVRAIVKVIPAAGNAISGVVAGGVTFGIGMAAINYFIEEGDIEKAKMVYKNSKKRYKENED